jgi:CRP-like cAMP-binding protein
LFARGRRASYLIDHITETDGDTAKIRLDLPRQVIASRLSFTPETLSRMLRILADEAIITADDRVIAVHSLSRLRPYN